MPAWLDDNRNGMALVVWGTGLYAVYSIVREPLGIAGISSSARGLVVIAAAVCAAPIGWGFLRHASWPQWAVVGFMLACAGIDLSAAMARPSLWSITRPVVSLSAAVVFIRFWDVQRRADVKNVQYQVHEFLNRRAPRPLAPCAVELQFARRTPVTRESLAMVVEKAFGRQCEVSDSTDNIDFGVDVACTTNDTAVVCGAAELGEDSEEQFDHFIIGARPVSIEVTWVQNGAGDVETNETTGILSIGTPRQFDSNESTVDGYDWTIPLAAALWSDATTCAYLVDEKIRFESPETMLEWKTHRPNA